MLATRRNSIRPRRSKLRARRGRRLVDKGPHGHWRAATFLAALRKRSHRGAPCIAGPIIELRRTRAFVRRHSLRIFERAAGFEILWLIAAGVGTQIEGLKT